LKLADDPREVYEHYWFEAELYKKDGQKRTKSMVNIFADTMYFFWIKEVPCLACRTKVPQKNIQKYM